MFNCFFFFFVEGEGGGGAWGWCDVVWLIKLLDGFTPEGNDKIAKLVRSK